MKVRIRPDLIEQEGDDICIVATAKFWLTPQDIESAEFLGSDETTGEVVLVLPNDWMGDEIPVVRVDSIDVEFIEEDNLPCHEPYDVYDCYNAGHESGCVEYLCSCGKVMHNGH